MRIGKTTKQRIKDLGFHFGIHPLYLNAFSHWHMCVTSPPTSTPQVANGRLCPRRMLISIQF